MTAILLLNKVPRKFFWISLKLKNKLGIANGRQRKRRIVYMRSWNTDDKWEFVIVIGVGRTLQKRFTMANHGTQSKVIWGPIYGDLLAQIDWLVVILNVIENPWTWSINVLNQEKVFYIKMVQNFTRNLLKANHHCTTTAKMSLYPLQNHSARVCFLPNKTTCWLTVGWSLTVSFFTKVGNCIALVGPGGLRAPPVVVDGSEAGHCFHLLFSSFSMPSAFRPLRGTSRAWKFVSPIFWHN